MVESPDLDEDDWERDHFFTRSEALVVSREIQQIAPRHLAPFRKDVSDEYPSISEGECFVVVLPEHLKRGGGGARKAVVIPPVLLSWAEERNVDIKVRPACHDDRRYRPRNELVFTPRQTRTGWRWKFPY